MLAPMKLPRKQGDWHVTTPDRRPQTGDVQVLSLMGFRSSPDRPTARRSIARTLNRHEQVRIGLLCGSVSAAFFRELLAGCVEQASLSHAQLVVARSDNREQQEQDAVKELLNMDVDGFFCRPLSASRSDCTPPL